MKILKIYITEFGGLNNRTLEFTDGINIIHGDNESGKSTLLAFIRFILYGMPQKRGEDSSADRDRALSWDNLSAGGFMDVSSGGNAYRVTRRGVMQNGSYVERSSITDLSSGVEVHRGEAAGRVLLGIPAAVYDSTCSVRQLGLADLDGTEVGAAVENLLFSADESTNTSRALAKLNTARRQLWLQRGNGGKLYELKAAADALAERLAKAEQASADTIRLRATVAKYRSVTVETRRKLNTATDRVHAYETLQTLHLFDMLHAGERKLASLRSEEEKLRAERGYSGALPDRAFVSDCDELIRRLAAADSGVSQASANISDVRSKQVGDPFLASHADDIIEGGGPDGIARDYTALRKRAGRRKAWGTLLICLGAVGVAVSLACYFTPLLSLLPFTVKFGIEAASTASVVFLGLAVTGIALLPSSRRAAKDASELLYSIGYDRSTNDGIGSAPGNATDIVSYCKSCIDANNQLSEYNTLLAGMESVLADRRNEAEAVRAECRDALATAGVTAGEDDDMAKLMVKLAGDAAETADRHGELLNDISKYSASVAESESRLSGENEASLRAHLSPDAEALLAGENLTSLMKERDGYAAALEAGIMRLNDAEKNLSITEGISENPARIALLLAEAENAYSECRRLYDAVVLAYESIEGAGETLRRNVTPRLRSTAGGLMASLTGGKYTDFGVDSDFSVSIGTPSGTHSIASLSAGTRDIAYLALRTALGRLLFPDPSDAPPLILDEVFAQLDDGRAENLLGVLRELTDDGDTSPSVPQCLILTCHNRESAILDRLGVKYNPIGL